MKNIHPSLKSSTMTSGLILILTGLILLSSFCKPVQNNTRERISLNEGWQFMKYPSAESADRLIYDIRPEVTDNNDNKDADSKPTDAVKVTANQEILKPWILPSANKFINDPSRRHIRPEGNPGMDFPFVKNSFDDSGWEKINLPHDWGIKGPFMKGWEAEVGGGMGRLAGHGVAWYRKKINISGSDKGKSVFLELEGAMSYAMVWLNGYLVGGWPYGYNSFQLDLTPYLVEGDNQIAIRLDNPPNSSRWYPGGGIYRNVWLIKTNTVHIGQWGTFITTPFVSKASATIDLEITLDSERTRNQPVEIRTKIFEVNDQPSEIQTMVAEFPPIITTIPAKGSVKVNGSVVIQNPRLWGPPPTQKPNLYKAVSVVYINGKPVDEYKTQFGIRSLEFKADQGIFINGEHILIKGVNQHHDLGALGTAFNLSAAERQLTMLKELGCNAIRMSHNPPAPELLDLADKMGFMVIDEVFDSWERKKTPLDFHLIFPEWHEADTRSFIRRDRNHASIILWSFGNEVGEQYTGEEGAAIAKKLRDIVKEEDTSRPAISAMNYAKPDMPFPQNIDIISLNYQGEGIRDAEAYAALKGITTTPQYAAFHEKFPEKVIVSTETASTLSTRGTYIFPVYHGNSAPAMDTMGGNPDRQYVSAYELYSAPFGASPDKVFASQDKHPYVAGEFVWTGWDHLGEPTPYYLSRSSYCGIIDLAGFKKDRFYLYQSRWRPELPMAHILPHWNWPGRVGMVTPVHVFTSGDEAELFLNGQSLGKKKKGPYEYRLRWDSVQYTPGELKVVTWLKGKPWAESKVVTTGSPAKIMAVADRANICHDLSFIEVRIADASGLTVPDANNRIVFSLEGSGEIVATDNGDPTDMEIFGSQERNAFNGYALVIVRVVNGMQGTVILTAKSEGLDPAILELTINPANH